jgi:hypothetical protein
MTNPDSTQLLMAFLQDFYNMDLAYTIVGTKWRECESLYWELLAKKLPLRKIFGLVVARGTLDNKTRGELLIWIDGRCITIQVTKSQANA